MLGAKSRGLKKYLLLEFVGPGFLACLLGVSLSVVAALIFSSLFFDSLHSFDVISIFSIFILGVMILVTLALLVSSEITKAKPLEELRSG